MRVNLMVKATATRKAQAQAAAPSLTFKVPVGDVIAGANDRKDFNAKGLAGLADSIEANGLAQPMTLRRIADGKLEIVAGERRFRAMRDNLHYTDLEVAVLPKVQALIKDDLSDENAASIMLAENMGRQGLNPIEEARAYDGRMKQFGWDEAKTAKVAGKTVERVKRRVSLLRLVDVIQELVALGQFQLAHAEALVDLDENRQRVACRAYTSSESMTLPQFRRVIADLQGEQDQDKLFDISTFWIEQIAQEAAIVKRGADAVTHAPTSPTLPPVVTTTTDTTSLVVERYINVLLAAGEHVAAGAIGTLYDALVKANFLSLPDVPLLSAAPAAEEVASV